MNENEALRIILDALDDEDIALFSTGYISRRAYSIKDREGNFYMLGSMGLLSSLGLGLALQNPNRRITVIEGDGSFLMSLNTLPLVAHLAPKNFHHIVLDNGVYESTGGQPSISSYIDLGQIAVWSGYQWNFYSIKNLGEFLVEGPTFMVVEVEPGGEVGSRVSLPPEKMVERLGKHLGAV